jgi:hypothetical protein
MALGLLDCEQMRSGKHKRIQGRFGSRASSRADGLPEPSPAVTRLVWVLSGGVCAFPNCRLRLLDDTANSPRGSAIGKVAHIVARSPDGPRGGAQPPGGDVNGVKNLVLLCPTHHDTIDAQAAAFTVERLLGIKQDHERWVREQLAVQEAGDDAGLPHCDTVHSTLLLVDQIPRLIFTAACDFQDPEVKGMIRPPTDPATALPYFVEAGQLFTFTSLTSDGHPFADVVKDAATVQRHRAVDWWQDQDRYRWYVRLLNRALNKLTGRRELNLDKLHHRYFFEAARGEGGLIKPRRVTYRPLNRDSVERNVVWQPIRKKTGKPRHYWIHQAVALRFLRVAPTQWVLCIRPEVRLTRDGVEPLPSDAIGPRATSLRSHLYNYELLGELQFWKDYLANGQPRIILDFGGQSLVIDAQLMQTSIDWPGVPGDDLPFENTSREDDLFSAAAYDRAMGEGRHIDAELEEWEVRDLKSMAEESAPEEAVEGEDAE